MILIGPYFLVQEAESHAVRLKGENICQNIYFLSPISLNSERFFFTITQLSTFSESKRFPKNPYKAENIRSTISRQVRDLAQKAKWSKIFRRKRIQALPTISNNLWQSLIGINPHQSPITISFEVCKSQKSKYVGKSMKPILECLEL